MASEVERISTGRRLRRPAARCRQQQRARVAPRRGDGVGDDRAGGGRGALVGQDGEHGGGGRGAEQAAGEQRRRGAGDDRSGFERWDGAAASPCGQGERGGVRREQSAKRGSAHFFVAAADVKSADTVEDEDPAQ